MFGTYHEVDYELLGSDIQIVEIELDPEETIVAEIGAMIYMEDNITFETRIGDGTETNSLFGKFLGAGKRILGGESAFMTHFTNKGDNKARVAFAAPHPGQVIVVNLAQVGGEIICQKDAFLCAAKGTTLDIAFSKKLGAGFFGGKGFIFQRLRGIGKAFIHAGGTVVMKKLNNQALRIDTGCVVGFTTGIEYDIKTVRRIKSIFFGGEGLFLSTLRGTGIVYLQSMPFPRLVDRIISRLPKKIWRKNNIS